MNSQIQKIEKIVVTGGRDFNDQAVIDCILQIFKDCKIIVQGEASGADSCAKKYAIKNKLECVPYEAEWNNLTYPDARIKTNKYGKKYDAQAGHRRNHKMLSENRDSIVIAFPGGHGTKDCVKSAIALNMTVFVVEIIHDEICLELLNHACSF